MLVLDARQQRRNLFILLSVFAPACFGLFTDFHASPEWVTASWCITFGGGIPLSVWLVRRMQPYMPPLRPLRKNLAVVLGIPGVFILIWGALLARTFPDIYTRLAGDPFTLVQEAHKSPGSGKGWWLFCRYAVHAPVFRSGSPQSHYCTGRAEYEALPWRGEVNIRGHESWFGKHVDRVDPITPE